MELPSVRELELETLLREKDAQLAEMTVCVFSEQYLSEHDPATSIFYTIRLKRRFLTLSNLPSCATG